MDERQDFIPESNSEPKKNINKTKLIVILVSVAVLVFLSWCVYNNYLKKISQEQYNNSNNTNEASKKEEETQIINDFDKQDILNKISTIVGFDGQKEDRKEKVFYGINNTFYEIFTGSISNSIKLAMTLHSKDISDGKKSICGDIECWIVDQSSIEKAYLNLFNEQVTHQSLGDDKTKCLPVNYNKNSLSYEYDIGAGCFIDGDYLDYYVYDYKTEDNTLEAYVSFGIYSAYEGKMYKILTTEQKTDSYHYVLNDETFVENTLKEDFENMAKVDSSNYFKYSKYKFIFQKSNNGNYYFSKIEKVN